MVTISRTFYRQAVFALLAQRAQVAGEIALFENVDTLKNAVDSLRLELVDIQTALDEVPASFH